MMKNKINNTYYIILFTLASSFLICLCFIKIFVFKSHFIINVSGDSSEGFLFDSITSLVGIITVIFVALAFKQQTHQMKIASADKKFERCLLLIADIDKLENKILFKVIPPFGNNPISSKGGEAIDDYIMWLKKAPLYSGAIEDHINLRKDLFVYLYNASIILYYISTLKKGYAEHFQILYAKFFLNNPRLYSQAKEMLKYKDNLIQNDINNTRKGIIEQLQKIKTGIEIQSEAKKKESDGKDKNK
jgi:hypothetical protein